MELLVGKKFRIGPKIGGGTFGEIYSGTDVDTFEEVAIKLEPQGAKQLQLSYEARIYRALQGGGMFLFCFPINVKPRTVYNRSISSFIFYNRWITELIFFLLLFLLCFSFVLFSQK